MTETFFGKFMFSSIYMCLFHVCVPPYFVLISSLASNLAERHVGT